VESEKIMLSVVPLTSLKKNMVQMAAKRKQEIHETVFAALFDLVVITIIL
jgi:hypothetical protein